MLKLKTLFLCFILQYSTTFSLSLCHLFRFYPCEENPNYSTTEPAEHLGPTFTECPEGKSLISRKDIEILIDHIAKNTLKIKESLVEGYYQKAVDVNSKYVEQLNKYQEQIEEQPKHLKHILGQMEDERLSLEPTVKQIAVEIEEGDVNEEQLSELSNRLQKLLTMLDAYEVICQMNTGNQQLERRLKHKQSLIPSNEHIPQPPICGSLKEFHNEIAKQLTNFRDEYIKEILIAIEVSDNNYSTSVASHNKELKKIAMRQHKNVMYDILKLQDDYIHFKEHLREFNVTQILDDTKNNSERIELLLNGLEEDVHDYGRHCVGKNDKRDKSDLAPIVLKIRPKRDHNNLKIIDELTQLKIEEIKNEVLKNVTDIFKELDEHLNNVNGTLDSNSEKNIPNPDELDGIKRAQEALIELKSIIPQSSFEKLQKLRQKSQEILQKTEKAKENLGSKLK